VILLSPLLPVIASNLKEANSNLTIVSFQVVIESDEVPSEPSLLQTIFPLILQQGKLLQEVP